MDLLAMNGRPVEFDDSCSITTAPSIQESLDRNQQQQQQDEDRPADEMDIRHFYPRSKAVMLAAPKSLMSSHNVSFLVKGDVEDKSITDKSSAVQSLASQLNAQGRSNVPKCSLNAVDFEQKFKMNCFNAFKRHAIKTVSAAAAAPVHHIDGHVMDTGDAHGVPALQLPSAMQSISGDAPRRHTYQLMDSLALQEQDVLSWKEFESFAYTLFAPLLERNSRNSHGSGRGRAKSTGAIRGGNTRTPNLSGPLAAPRVSGTIVPPSTIQANAFMCLQRKQRAADAAPAYNPNGSVHAIAAARAAANAEDTVTGGVSRTPWMDYYRRGKTHSRGGGEALQASRPNSAAGALSVGIYDKTMLSEGSVVLGENLDGTLVPASVLSEALVDVVKWNERRSKRTVLEGGKSPTKDRHSDIGLLSPTRLKPNRKATGAGSGHSTCSASTHSDDTSQTSSTWGADKKDGVDGSSPPPLERRISTLSMEQLEYRDFRHRLPLGKSKINEMVNPREAYSEKWHKMKKIRDARTQAAQTRAQRQALLRDMTTLSIAAERCAILQVLLFCSRSHVLHPVALSCREVFANRIDVLKQSMGSSSVMRYQMLRAEDVERREQIRVTKEAIKEQKKAAARKLDEALFASTTMSRSQLLEEEGERSTWKEGSITKLPSCSSTMVEIPDKFDEAIAKARTQAQWDAAMKAKKDYREKILSDRIYDYNMAKNKAKLRAMRPGSLADDSCFSYEAPGTPERSQEYFTSTQTKDEDLISFNIEYAKYLGDSYSLPSLRPISPAAGTAGIVGITGPSTRATSSHGIGQQAGAGSGFSAPAGQKQQQQQQQQQEAPQVLQISPEENSPPGGSS